MTLPPKTIPILLEVSITVLAPVQIFIFLSPLQKSQNRLTVGQTILTFTAVFLSCFLQVHGSMCVFTLYVAIINTSLHTITLYKEQHEKHMDPKINKGISQIKMSLT